MKKLQIIILICVTLNIYGQKHAGNFKSYSQLIAQDVVSKKGFLTTHQSMNRLYLEIPSQMLGKDMLFVKHEKFARYKQIRWVKRGDRIHLIIHEIDSKLGNKIPLIGGKGGYTDKLGVELAPAIFPILTIGNNGTNYVIDVTPLFLRTPKELPGGGRTTVDNEGFINKVLAFEDVIEITVNKVVSSENGPTNVVQHFSIALLPETPMMPRLWDHRMGFMKVAMDKYSMDMDRSSIYRWRLEKKNPNLAVSEPVRPITLYFDQATPDKWKPYIKAGVEEWLPAFEAAGFKNAILVKEPPAHDKDWSRHSMRYSYIAWHNNSKYSGHTGEGIAGTIAQFIDGRTGEILKCDILIGDTNYLADEYFIRCSPLDQRARQYPLPDDLMGELIQQVVAHEAGHVFGLKDGNFGEYTYPFEKMRDEKWLRKMGHTPSVMNYTRHNYVVQPEDSIPPPLLMQKVGPTDIHTIRWGYTPFIGVDTPDNESPYLEKIVTEGDTVPWYGSYTQDILQIPVGPANTNEVADSDNPIKATALGLKNLKRVIKLIPYAAKNERGYKTKHRLYSKTLQLWEHQMKSVVSLIGGFTIHHKSGGQEAIHIPVSADFQEEAVAFLIQEVFNESPLWLAPLNITRRIENCGDNDLICSNLRILSRRQINIVYDLLQSQRLRNLEEIEITAKRTYTIAEYFNDLHQGIWGELKAKDVKINRYRQQIQLAYVSKLTSVLNLKHSNSRTYSDQAINQYSQSNYVRGIILNELKELKRNIEKAMKNTKDIATKGHLELCLLEINKD